MPLQSISHVLTKVFFFLCIINPYRTVWGQTDVDSIMMSLGYPSEDTSSILALYDIGYEIEIEQPEKAMKLYKKGIVWSKEINYANGAGKGFNYCGIVQFNLGLIDSAILYAKQSLPWFEEAGNQLGYAASLNNVGNGHNIGNNYEAAIQAYQEANEIYETAGEDMNIISNLNNIGKYAHSK